MEFNRERYPNYLVSLIFDSKTLLAFKRAKAKQAYKRAPEKKSLRRGERGREPFEAFSQETPEQRRDWKEYRTSRPQAQPPYNPLRGKRSRAMESSEKKFS